MMKQALIAALSLFLAIFLTGPQIHAGQCQGPAQKATCVHGRNEDGNATLMHSVFSPKPVKDVPRLLPEGAVASGTNVTDESALFNASGAGNGNTVELRAKAGASPDMTGGNGGTALIAVPDNRNVRIVRALRLPVAPPSLDSQEMESPTEAGKILSRRGACRMTAAIQAISRGPPQCETRAPLRRAGAGSAVS